MRYPGVNIEQVAAPSPFRKRRHHATGDVLSRNVVFDDETDSRVDQAWRVHRKES
jgi:hypothetical protein